MAMIVNEPTFGGRLGEAMGTGLSQGLQTLVQMKVKQYQQKQNEGALRQMFPDMPATGIRALAQMSPEYAKHAIPQMLKNTQQQKAMAYVQSKYGTQTKTGIGNLIQPEQSELEAETPGQAAIQPSPYSGFESVLNLTPGQQAQYQMTSLMGQGIPQPETQTISSTRQQPPTAKTPIRTTQPTQPTQREYQPGETLMTAVAMGTPLAQAMTLEQGAAKAAFNEKKLNFAETKKLRESIDESAKFGRTDIKNSKLQLDLIKSGKLIGAKENAFLEWVGEKMGMSSNQIDAFRNGESQVFQKLSVPFFRNLKPSFGSKPTQWEAMQLQKGFASLYQTPEGREIIAKLTIAEGKSALKAQQIKDAIVAKHNNIPPLNLNEQINNELDKWQAQEFIKMRHKISNILARDAGLDDASAAKAGKGSSLTLDDGVMMISTGKKWEMANADNMRI